MDLDALRFGNFSQLGEAVSDWEQMTKNLSTLKTDAQEKLKARADKANWSGVNATVTREFIDRTAAEFADAHTQADSIAKILSDTRGELIGYRTQLNDAIERGTKKHLTVVDTGKGTFSVHQAESDDGSKADRQDAECLKGEIEQILHKAAASDTSAAKVLRLLVDQAKYGFVDAVYENRDEAAGAVAAAEKLARMAKDPADMTLGDISAFNRAMERHHGDSLFAEQFAKRLGAKGTLQFWTEMTSTHAGARSELETMKDLQTNLGLTLATASFSDSDGMQDWKKHLIAERNTNFRAAGSPNPVGALGAQVISSLLRRGRFDTEFLDDYREKVFKADKGAGDSATHDLWVKGYDGLDLVFGAGNGRDPLEGLFDGLAHNPEAAAHAFRSKSDLDHMLGTTMYTDRGASLGHALEAAVTGVASGDTISMAPPHSAAQVQIMANIMHAVAQPGSGADLVTTGLGASFGDMAASYMPEISRALGGPNAELVFLANGDDPGGLETADVTRFLSAVSQDPAGRAGIIYGESIYTGNLLEAHLSNPALFDGPRHQVLEDIGRNAGTIEGIVGHSVADDDVEDAVDDEKDYNDALKAKGDCAKTWLAVGSAFIQIPERLGGSAMGAVVGGGIGAVAGAAVDRLLEGQELSGARDEALYSSVKDLYKMRDSVNQQTQRSVTDALERHQVDLPRGGIKDTIRVAVNEGWDDASEFLSNSKDRPHG